MTRHRARVGRRERWQAGTDLVRAPAFFDAALNPPGTTEFDLLIAFTGRKM